MRKGLILMLVLIAFFPAAAWAQDAFAVGDRVEAQDCAHGCLWRAGTVREQYGLSVVVFDSNVLPDGTQLDDMWGIGSDQQFHQGASDCRRRHISGG